MTPPSGLYLVVEERTDAPIIRAIVGEKLSGRLRIFAAGGGISLASVGRNILVHEGGPVLLVMDAETRSQHLVDERRSMALLALSGVAQPGFSRSNEWAKVFAFVPEIEVIFFEAPQSLEIIRGEKIPKEKIEEGLLAPKATLLKILDEHKISYAAMVANVSPQAASILAASGQARALKATIESMMTPAVKV